MKLNPLEWFRREPSWNETKQSAVGGIVSAWTVGRPVWTERDYGALSQEAYVINAIGNRCVRYLAGSAAPVPWLLYRGKEEVTEHPILDLLRVPGPLTDQASFFEAFYSYLLISGNSYVEAVGPIRGAPKELWPLRPDRMQVIPGPKGLPAGYEYSANGQKYRWDVDRITGRSAILHVKEFHPRNDWYGLGRVDPAAYGIDRHNAAAEHNKALLDNGARPSGALVFEPLKGANGEYTQTASNEVLQAAEQRLNDRHGGPKNAGRPLVLGGLVKWEEMGLSPKDMDFSSNKDDAARDICTSFGVPHILVVPGEATYNNLRDAKLDVWEQTIIPMIERLVGALNGWLAPMYGDDLRLAVDYDAVPALEPRREAKRASVENLFDKGIITRDEARDALQYDPWPENAVAKVDANVLKATIDGITKVGVEPAERYLQETGLYPEGLTIAQAVAALPDDIFDDDNPDDVAAAMTPRGQPQNDGTEDVDANA